MSLKENSNEQNLRPKRNRKSRLASDGILYGDFAIEYLDEYFNYQKKTKTSHQKRKSSKSDKKLTITKSEIPNCTKPVVFSNPTDSNTFNNESSNCSNFTISNKKSIILENNGFDCIVEIKQTNNALPSNKKVFLDPENLLGSIKTNSEINTTQINLLNKSTRPRWYNQAYLVFLALRQSENFTATRKQLLAKVVELDKKFSNKLGVPRAFNGKTPTNSASAILTRNDDMYFIQSKPENSKHFVYKLAYKPGDFASAVLNYNKWNNNLFKKHWPICFNHTFNTDSITDSLQTQSVSENNNTPKIAPQSELSIISNKDQIIGISGSASEDLKLLEIPKCWLDIVSIKKSSIPSAGNGLFAKIFLPAGIPLGFYFGVPMTEDEFDYHKDKVGKASHYSIMYRKTVLDATDEDGMPYTKINGPMFCPFHFMNDDRQNKKYNITFVDGEIVNQVICYTTKNITPGEELFVYYGSEVDDKEWESNVNGISQKDNVENKV
ncbi:hypothetical protein BB561_003484 [Smittium simulii]|uniref:SET domain-containing protein n=1 Tax=Smittium simulii TaxID=133385 RepID=A0A2T9YL64_9FUNG|nr:hypothetical protein BB561_003484 [Smittium simulii]